MLVRTVHYEDQPVSTNEVVPPQWTDLVLPANVPHGERDVFDRRQRLDIESDGGYGIDDLVQFQLVQDSGLACCIQSQHEDLSRTIGESIEESLESISDS